MAAPRERSSARGEFPRKSRCKPASSSWQVRKREIPALLVDRRFADGEPQAVAGALTLPLPAGDKRLEDALAQFMGNSRTLVLVLVLDLDNDLIPTTGDQNVDLAPTGRPMHRVAHKVADNPQTRFSIGQQRGLTALADLDCHTLALGATLLSSQTKLDLNRKIEALPLRTLGLWLGSRGAAVCLLIPALVLPGALLLACILAGAAVTHLRFDPPMAALSPVVFLALVACLIVSHWPRR
jgi:hypothetical protein